MTTHNSYNNEPTGKYPCRFCGKECGVKGFSSHLRLHQIDFDSYVRKFINNFPADFPEYKWCMICKENLTVGTTCSKKCNNEWARIRQQGRNIWAEMSEETRINAKQQISQKASINQIGRNIWAEMDDETKKNAKKSISEKTSLRVRGSGNPMYGRIREPEVIKKMFARRGMNKVEHLVADFLKFKNIEYQYQFFQKTPNRNYFYDFRIIDTNILIEVDGDYWHGGPGSKTFHRTVNENKIVDEQKNILAKNNNFILLRFWESEIKSDFKSVEDRILQEINSRKIT